MDVFSRAFSRAEMGLFENIWVRGEVCGTEPKVKTLAMDEKYKVARSQLP